MGIEPRREAMGDETRILRAHLPIAVLAVVVTGGCSSRVSGDESEANLYHIAQSDLCPDAEPPDDPVEVCQVGDLDVAPVYNWAPTPFVADAPAVFQMCVQRESDQFVRQLRGTCDVALTGDELRVTGEASWEQEYDEGSNLHSRCVFVQCESPPLPAGDYMVSMAEWTCPFTVPSEPTQSLVLANYSTYEGCWPWGR
jgi:hypothetical protein